MWLICSLERVHSVAYELFLTMLFERRSFSEVLNSDEKKKIRMRLAVGVLLSK
jgi:hypothetical protein